MRRRFDRPRRFLEVDDARQTLLEVGSALDQDSILTFPDGDPVKLTPLPRRDRTRQLFIILALVVLAAVFALPPFWR